MSFLISLLDIIVSFFFIEISLRADLNVKLIIYCIFYHGALFKYQNSFGSHLLFFLEESKKTSFYEA